MAGRCCAYLLQRSGISFSVGPASRVGVPAILLSASALALLRDVFGNGSLLQDAYQITRRVVAWNRGAPPVTLPHSAVVVSEELLLRGALPELGLGSQQQDYTVYAASPLPEGVTVHGFGTRRAVSCAVALRRKTLEGTCWMESLAGGWLFLVQDGPGSGWLLCVGGSIDELLPQSQLVREQIDERSPIVATFAAYPRIASALAAPGWLTCGTAAMAFDPICGDGTAYAVREGILASAVVAGLSQGGDAEALLRHYQARSIAGFRRHLELCREFYNTGYGGAWWTEELASIEQGIAWCALEQRSHSPFQFRLNGFALERLV